MSACSVKKIIKEGDLLNEHKEYDWKYKRTNSKGDVIFRHETDQTVKDVCGQTKIEHDGNKIEFKGPYKRLAFFDAIKEIKEFISD